LIGAYRHLRLSFLALHCHLVPESLQPAGYAPVDEAIPDAHDDAAENARFDGESNLNLLSGRGRQPPPNIFAFGLIVLAGDRHLGFHDATRLAIEAHELVADLSQQTNALAQNEQSEKIEKSRLHPWQSLAHCRQLRRARDSRLAEKSERSRRRKLAHGRLEIDSPRLDCILAARYVVRRFGIA
jgi:hypothetical protein